MTCNLRHCAGLRHPIRPIGFKLQVIFCQRALNHRILLRKMIFRENKASCGSSPPRKTCRWFRLACSFIHIVLFTFFYSHSLTHALADTLAHTYTHIQTHAHAHTRVHTRVHTRAHIPPRILSHTRTHKKWFANAHTHSHTHTPPPPHTHTCINTHRRAGEGGHPWGVIMTAEWVFFFGEAQISFECHQQLFFLLCKYFVMVEMSFFWGRGAFLLFPCFVHTCDMSDSYVWDDVFMCVTWRIHVCDMTHSCVWHDAFMCVTWRIHACDMTHSCVWHDSFICVTWCIHVSLFLFLSLSHTLLLSLSLLHERTTSLSHTYISVPSKVLLCGVES